MNETKWNILVADDNPENLKVLMAALEDEQYNIRVAFNGKEALESLEEALVDLILLDINMPILDGFETCRLLKINDRTKHIPVIFLTADLNSESILKGLEIGGVDYITKPFATHELKLRVSTHLKIIEVNNEKLKIEYLVKEDQERLRMLHINGKTLENLSRSLAAEIQNPLDIIEDGIKFFDSTCSKIKHIAQSESSSAIVSQADALLNMTTTMKSNATKIKKVVGSLDLLSPDIELEIKNIDIHSLGTNIYMSLMSEKYSDYDNRNLSFSIDILEDAGHINSLEESFAHSIREILDNSIQAIIEKNQNSKKQIHGHISIISKKIGDDICISIKDNGSGMSPKCLENAMNPFFSTRNSNEHQGLGLTLAKSIVSTHLNGTLDIDSVEGEYTEVTQKLKGSTNK
ncbi:response regulator [Bacteriovoracaceae bacterium]|nr:response regulator [Bacteriovoracaceae bacterium]